MRNIDHLPTAIGAAPAFVFGWKCFPRRELRAALAVVDPKRADWLRATRLLDEPDGGVYDDLGEQSVWRRLYPLVHELPAGYCALRAADLPAEEWGRVHVLHDPHLIHKYHRAGWEASNLSARIRALELESDRVFKPLARFFVPPPRPPGRGTRRWAAARARNRTKRAQRRGDPLSV